MKVLAAGFAATCLASAAVSAEDVSTHMLLERAKAGVRTGRSTSIVVRLMKPGRPGSGGPLFDFDEAARQPSSTKDFEDATVCHRFLNRHVGREVSSWPFEAAIRVYNAASRQAVPVGVVGTCGIDALGDRAKLVRVSRNTTVRAALDAVLAQAPGVAWLAVEGVDGTCGIGLYGLDLTQPPPGFPRNVGERFCMVQIGKVPPPGRAAP